MCRALSVADGGQSPVLNSPLSTSSHHPLRRLSLAGLNIPHGVLEATTVKDEDRPYEKNAKDVVGTEQYTTMKETMSAKDGIGLVMAADRMSVDSPEKDYAVLTGSTTGPAGSAVLTGSTTGPAGSAVLTGSTTGPAGSSVLTGSTTGPVGSAVLTGSTTGPAGSSVLTSSTTGPASISSTEDIHHGGDYMRRVEQELAKFFLKFQIENGV